MSRNMLSRSLGKLRARQVAVVVPAFEREIAFALARVLVIIPLLALLLWWEILSTVGPLAAGLLE